MGQKVNPISLRSSTNKRWNSKGFFLGFNYASLLHQDLLIQRYIHGVLHNFKILCNKCIIKRLNDIIYINIFFYLKFKNKFLYRNKKKRGPSRAHKNKRFGPANKNRSLVKILSFFNKTKSSKSSNKNVAFSQRNVAQLKKLSKRKLSLIREKELRVLSKTTSISKKVKLKNIVSTKYFLSLAKVLEDSLVRLTKSNIRLRFIPLYTSSKKRYNLSLIRIAKFINLEKNLHLIHVFETSFGSRNAVLLADFLSLNLVYPIKRSKVFLNIIKRLSKLFFKHHGLKGFKFSLKGRMKKKGRTGRTLIQVGRLPLNSFSADIHYGFANRITAQGVFGVRVWLYY